MCAAVNKKVKVVAFGSVNGAVERLVENMKKINSSNAGPFDLFLVAGNMFFPSEMTESGIENVNQENENLADSLINNQFAFPVPTYFIAGSAPFPEALSRKAQNNSGEICPNFTFLGKSGVLTTSGGIKLAFLSGTLAENSEEATETKLNLYNSEDVSNLLCKTPEYIDILLTYDWPEKIEVNSLRAKSIKGSHPKNTSFVTSLCQHFKPKYHFATSSPSLFFEREPFKILAGIQPDVQQFSVSRFLSLGESEPASKQRWFYAFNLNLGPQLLSAHELPANISESPYAKATQTKRLYTEEPQTNHSFDNFNNDNNQKTQDSNSKKKRGHDNTIPPDSYTCKICSVKGHYLKNCPEKKLRTETQVGKLCWFCLSNPELAKHLIVSVAELLYVSIAKGTLIDPFSPSCLVPGGGNILILTINHYNTFSLIPPENQLKVNQELQNYKKALADFFDKFEAAPVYYELHAPGSFKHAHKQVVPIPQSTTPSIEEFFINQARLNNWNLDENNVGNISDGYLELELPNGKTLIGLPPQGQRLDFQLPRKILSEFLNIPDRADWRKIEYSIEQETDIKSKFADAFAPFDPSK